jgi:DNA-binding transcriptional LysR family regulator
MGVPINLRQLEVFSAIMRVGTVTGAARELGLSQPAVSRILHHAESQFGIQLFQRHQGRLRPTDDARSLFPAVDALFQDAEAIRALIDDLRDNKSGIIRVASIATIGSTFLPRAIAGFMNEQRKIKFAIRIMNVRALVTRVIERKIDVAIAYAPFGDGVTDMVELGTTEVTCVLPTSHRLAGKKIITPHDLVDELLISARRDIPMGEGVDMAFVSSGITRNNIVETANSQIAYDLVAQGVGVAVIDPFSVDHHRPAGVVLREFRPTVRVQPRVLYLKDPPPSRPVQEFIKHLKATARTLLHT